MFTTDSFKNLDITAYRLVAHSEGPVVISHSLGPSAVTTASVEETYLPWLWTPGFVPVSVLEVSAFVHQEKRGSWDQSVTEISSVLM